MKNLKRLILISIFAIGLIALASLGFAQSEGSGTVGGGQILGPVAGGSGAGQWHEKACVGQPDNHRCEQQPANAGCSGAYNCASKKGEGAPKPV